jgi:hypothetical protein
MPLNLLYIVYYKSPVYSLLCACAARMYTLSYWSIDSRFIETWLQHQPPNYVDVTATNMTVSAGIIAVCYMFQPLWRHAHTELPEYI